MRYQVAALAVIVVAVCAAAVAIAGACAWADGTAAPSTAPTSAPAAMDALLAQLGAPDYRTRQKAQDALVALGDRAVEPVERFAQETARPQRRSGRAAVLERIKADRGLGPTFVTTSLPGATI